nr:hypothetical protein [Pseudomonas sp. LPH1]
MKNIKSIILLAVCCLVTACSGTLYTVINPDLTAPDVGEKIVEGVIVYQVVDVVEVYQTTALVDDDKNITGSAPNNCQPKRSLKFTTRADYSKPYVIKYDAAFLETHTFGVTLEGGVLTGVNTSSDPSKFATSAAALLPFVATPNAPAFLPSGKPFCNEQNSLVGVFRAPDIRGFNEIPEQ